MLLDGARLGSQVEAFRSGMISRNFDVWWFLGVPSDAGMTKPQQGSQRFQPPALKGCRCVAYLFHAARVPLINLICPLPALADVPP